MPQLAILPPASSTATAVEGGAESLSELYRRRQARLSGAGRFVRLLAEGGMGAALLVEQVPGVGRGPFALKLLRRDRVASPESVARFRRELACHERLARTLQVPRLVACLAVRDDPEPELAWALFPYFAQGTLEDRLTRGIRASDAVLLLADAVEGLQSLHGHGYVHRDVHPRNIFVEREGGRLRGVLGDLGVGLFLEGNTLVSDAEIAADSARRIGHTGYIDPVEQATPAADLYGVGATLYRILAGREPVDRPRPAGLGLQGAGGALARDAELRAVAAGLIGRLTTADRERRIATAREARAGLVALAERLQRAERRGRAVLAVGRSPEPGGGRRIARPLAWLSSISILLVAGLWSATALLRRPAPPQVGAERPAALLPAAATPAPAEATRAVEPRVSDPAPTPEAVEVEVPAPSRTLRPAPSRPLPPRSLDRELEAADGYLRSGQPAAAERVLRGVLLDQPAQPDAAVRLALLLAAGGARGQREAAALLASALAGTPVRGELRLTLGRLLLQLDRPEQAVAVLRAAPAGSSHGDEIAALAALAERSVTPGGGADRTR